MVQQVDWCTSSIKKNTGCGRRRANGTSELTQGLRFAGYNKVINAESVFRSIEYGVVVYLIIQIDDIMVLTESMKAMLSVKKQLSKMYTVRDLGEAEYFLGVKIERKT
jgi:hypothetical protein